jgi:hypothetical protein
MLVTHYRLPARLRNPVEPRESACAAVPAARDSRAGCLHRRPEARSARARRCGRGHGRGDAGAGRWRHAEPGRVARATERAHGRAGGPARRGERHAAGACTIERLYLRHADATRVPSLPFYRMLVVGWYRGRRTHRWMITTRRVRALFSCCGTTAANSGIGLVDEADHISARTLASVRYKRNHELMNEVFMYAAFGKHICNVTFLIAKHYTSAVGSNLTGDKVLPPAPPAYSSLFKKDELDEKVVSAIPRQRLGSIILRHVVGSAGHTDRRAQIKSSRTRKGACCGAGCCPGAQRRVHGVCRCSRVLSDRPIRHVRTARCKAFAVSTPVENGGDPAFDVFRCYPLWRPEASRKVKGQAIA